jgi:hypothetical protein
MKTLLFGAVFITPDHGDRFVTMANTMIDSARLAGYKDDLLIMSDQKLDIKQADVVITDPVVNRLTYPWDTLLMRSRIHKYVDLSKYDYIMYVDADTIINKPLDDLMKFMADKNMIGAQGEGMSLNHMHKTHLYEFAEHERKLYGRNMAYCSGIVGWPGNELGLGFIKDWEEYCDKSNSNDQTVLNTLLYRKYVGKFMPLPGVGYHCGDGPSELTIAHFFRQKCKRHYYDYYNKYIAPKKAVAAVS